MDHRIEIVLTLFHEKFRQQLSTADLAKELNLSYWRLSHLFKTETGTPPHQYLRKLRMEEAKRLLETTFLSIKQVMVQVGLRDESHFVRDFKRTYGSSPTVLRNQVSKASIEKMGDSKIGQ
jgi:AraC-like DNA-binding protein